MSDAVTVPPTPSAASEGPYAVRTISYGGYDYTFTFYKGFASRVQYTPAGGSQPIDVYQQEGVFDCNDTGGPLPDSTFTIVGGPLNLDIQLDIDDGPLGKDYLGPIAALEIGVKRRGSAVIPPKRVRPLKGADQISRIVVRERGNGNGGGVHAFQDDDGGTVIVTNKAVTCPPTC
jgi:hypothetical protein